MRPPMANSNIVLLAPVENRRLIGGAVGSQVFYSFPSWHFGEALLDKFEVSGAGT